MAVKTVSTFMLPDEYQRQASEARRRRRMAEMLAQQAYQPGDIQNAPIPRGAPLVQGLQAFLAARGERKAEEAEESAMKAQTREARDFLRALTEPAKTMTIGEAAMQDIAQAGTPELVDGRLEYRKTAMPAPTPEMVPQAGPKVRLGRRPEDDQVYMPTATGRETDPQRMAAMLANPQYKAEFTPEQKRALALEGVLTSQNPLVQKIGQMQYGAMQPKQPEIGAVSPADFTPESLAKYQRTGNFGVLKMRDQPTAAPKTAAQDTLQWNPKTQQWEDIPGAVSRIRDIAEARRIVVNTGGGASNEPLERVEGPDGKPVLVRRSEAVGKTPAAAPSEKSKMPGSVATNIAALQTKSKQFAAGVQRANYFRNLIENDNLPLNISSGIQYSIQRATDPEGIARDSKGNKPPYVLYSELNRFVTEQVNTILQLAKGTQTEGDALRAQKQILDNPNNKAIVLSALEDLQRSFTNAQQFANEEAEFLLNRYEGSDKVEEVDY